MKYDIFLAIIKQTINKQQKRVEIILKWFYFDCYSYYFNFKTLNKTIKYLEYVQWFLKYYKFH